MKVSKFENLQWIYSEVMNITLGIENNLPKNECADVVFAKLAPKQVLKKHYHSRKTSINLPYEAFFFYNGANIKVLFKDGYEIINTQKPLNITFYDDFIHGIENLSEEELFFHVLCAPAHEDNEEVLL